MTTSLRPIIASAILFVFAAACSAQPAESEGKKALQDKIGREAQGRIELASFAKTDGQKRTMNGVDVYIMMFVAEIAFTERCKWFHHPMYPVSMRTEPVKNLQGWAKFMEDSQPDRAGEIVNRGDKRKIQAKILFEKTEKGWLFSFQEE